MHLAVNLYFVSANPVTVTPAISTGISQPKVKNTHNIPQTGIANAPKPIVAFTISYPNHSNAPRITVAIAKNTKNIAIYCLLIALLCT